MVRVTKHSGALAVGLAVQVHVSQSTGASSLAKARYQSDGKPSLLLLVCQSLISSRNHQPRTSPFPDPQKQCSIVTRSRLTLQREAVAVAVLVLFDRRLHSGLFAALDWEGFSDCRGQEVGQVRGG